jgi:uncharacterized membrane protein
MDAFDLVRKVLPLAALFIVCDLPWLYATSEWAQTMTKTVQGGAPMTIRWVGAPPVYLALGYLVLKTRGTLDAFLTGLAVYAVYDFTNYSTLAKYELNFAIADSIWGGLLFAIVHGVGRYLNLL